MTVSMMSETVFGTLVIGDKTYSSWSMRPWLVLKQAGAVFAEQKVGLYGPNKLADLTTVSPTGLVPLLRVGDLDIPDSLAISEYVAEAFPEAGLWPQDRSARAMARAATCEMHSGFTALRSQHPHHLFHRSHPTPSPEVTRELTRLVALWRSLRHRFGGAGPFLFGPFGIVDAFFTPVASRLRTYHLDPAQFGDEDGVAAAYAAALLANPHFLEWEADACTEGHGTGWA